ncbi:hypothetical protein EVAR_33006_1 [Eumeta japonica]|uniref:Uncharacterized protein n=1 Tax=Eumeta variegata TaxID=151549 RepID=A0A4C1VSV1_EUMVA|nr:hypothetical protein EVAR_33006_1 [Eumeta japonica]
MQIASAFKIRKTNTTVNDVCPHASARVRVAHSAMSDFSSHLTATDPAPFARRAARRTVTYHSIARSINNSKALYAYFLNLATFAFEKGPNGTR